MTVELHREHTMTLHPSEMLCVCVCVCKSTSVWVCVHVEARGREMRFSSVAFIPYVLEVDLPLNPELTD